MARLTDAVRAALGYWWNLVSDAARGVFTVTDTINAATDIAASVGQTLSPATNRAISTLYGYARQEVNAGNVFMASQPSQFINADMISTPPYARDVQEQETYPLYHVKFEYTYIDQAGNTQVSYRTSAFPFQLPATVGELTAQVLDDAEAMAAKYGHTLLSAIPTNILAV